jgi:hypothetical protein
MTSADYELIYLEAGIEVLEEYILSADIYWPIGASAPAGESPYPRLTLGSTLVYQQRVHARELNSEQYSRLASIDEAIDEIRSKWRTTWEQKAVKEFHSRLMLWKNFIQEYRDNPQNNVDRFSYEVLRRVMLELLISEAPDIPDEEMEMLTMLDRLLDSVFVSDEFIWEEDIRSAYPAETYWYLYGHPQS